MVGRTLNDRTKFPLRGQPITRRVERCPKPIPKRHVVWLQLEPLPKLGNGAPPISAPERLHPTMFRSDRTLEDVIVGLHQRIIELRRDVAPLPQVGIRLLGIAKRPIRDPQWI